MRICSFHTIVHITHNVIRGAYEDILKSLHITINETRDNVRKISEHLFTGQAARIETSSIPKNLKKEDFQGVNCWNQGPWLEIRSGSKNKDVNSPVLSLFFEDKFGNPISDKVKEQVRGDIAAYWIDMIREGEMPTHYHGLGFKCREHYRNTMEDKYPWLRLCEGHWKVKQIWINHWKKDRVPPPAANKKSKTPIEISSDTEDSSPAPNEPVHHTPIELSSDEDIVSTGSKRKHEDKTRSDSSSLKKFKGKGKYVGLPAGFNPARPRPKARNAMVKSTAKVGMVSECRFCSLTLAEYTQTDPL